MHGDEIRACWDAAAPLPDVTAGAATAAGAMPVGAAAATAPTGYPIDGEPGRTPVRKLEFVEVRSAAVATAPSGTRANRRRRKRAAAAAMVATATSAPATPTGQEVGSAGGFPGGGVASPESRWNLWGDLEP